MLLTVHVAYTHSIHELYMHMLPLTVYLAHTYSIHEQYMHLLPLTVYIAWHKMYTWNAYAHDAHGLHSLYIKCTWTVYAHATCSSYSLYKQYTTNSTQHTHSIPEQHTDMKTSVCAWCAHATKTYMHNVRTNGWLCMFMYDMRRRPCPHAKSPSCAAHHVHRAFAYLHCMAYLYSLRHIHAHYAWLSCVHMEGDNVVSLCQTSTNMQALNICRAQLAGLDWRMHAYTVRNCDRMGLSYQPRGMHLLTSIRGNAVHNAERARYRMNAHTHTHM